MSDTKIFLKCGKTGRWYGEADACVDEVSEAREFTTVEEAMRVGQKVGTCGMVVVLQVRSGRRVVFPLKPRV